MTLIGYFLNGVQLRKADSEGEWKREVLKKYPICGWIECGMKSVDCHHIVKKGSHVDIALVIENGVGFCRWHHGRVERLIKQRYWDLMELVVGSELCKMLRRM